MNSFGQSGRIGIASGGNWIVDRVKRIDHFPERGMLANILSESCGTGGAAANVLIDLARLGASFPLCGMGVLGDDAEGAFVLGECTRHGIDTQFIRSSSKAPTSYTDVMTEADSGDRTFYHNRGANALFGPGHVPVRQLSSRIFHLGYLLLLDLMDQTDPVHGTAAARLLKELQEAGIKTSVDVVSEDSDRFRLLVPPALKYIDYLILNEIEIGRIVGVNPRRADGGLDCAALVESVETLHGLGRMEFVAVHMPEGVYLRDRQGHRWSQGSRILPPGHIQSAVGAGDACCAGMLYGLHEGWGLRESAELGIATATASLADSTASGGVGPCEEVLALARQFPERPPPLSC